MSAHQGDGDGGRRGRGRGGSGRGLWGEEDARGGGRGGRGGRRGGGPKKRGGRGGAERGEYPGKAPTILTKPKEEEEDIPRNIHGSSERGRLYEPDAQDVPVEKERETGRKRDATRAAQETANLLNKQFEFRADQADKLMSDEEDFFVVGVLGKQGVGKSTIMSYLYGGAKDVPPHRVFETQTTEQIIECKHQTIGIELAVTGEHMILLDAQALLGPGMLRQMIQKDVPLGPTATSHENLLELQSLRIAIFLLSVCNVVLVAQDAFPDMGIARFVQTAEMLKHRIPEVWAAADAPSELNWSSDMLIVLNKLPADAFSASSRSGIEAALDSMFAQSRFMTRRQQGSTAGSVPYACLPYDPSVVDPSAAPQTHALTDGFNSAGDALRTQLLSSKWSKFGGPLSERTWLKNAGRTWDVINRSSALADYNRTSQKMLLFKG